MYFKRKNNAVNTNFSREDSSDIRLRKSVEADSIDVKYGFERVKDHLERTGFLVNMHINEILDDDRRLISVVDYYFIQESDYRFKVSVPYKPYFLLKVKNENMQELSVFLMKKYAGLIHSIETVIKEDLDLPNHLIGLKQKYLKLNFFTITELQKVKQALMPIIRKNRNKQIENTHYRDMLTKSIANEEDAKTFKKNSDNMEGLLDIREYDVPYHVRVSIDLEIFVGLWYNVKCCGIDQIPIIKRREDLLEHPDIKVLAFDIETTKLPLKFPDAAIDQIMMISYMIDGKGFLITNREIISEDIEDFEYTPKPDFKGLFTIFNEENEAALLAKFFEHIMEERPLIFVTYNGDFFDWPFIEARAAIHEMNLNNEIGFSKGKDGVYSSRPAIHMDCLCWVKRDSYLPVGSQNLKAVAKAKLRYDPVELDPEDMCRLAVEKPQILSNYSVSDAVATYYLYMKYVHPFIFALCTIIPMEPDEILRKGSGTLCEALLMVQAFHANIVFPNKQQTQLNKLTDDGHVLDQETYVGGHVEALESGVFRADIPCRFRLEPKIFNSLIDNIEKTLKHAIEIEENIPLDKVVNLDEISKDIKSKLTALRESPNRLETPVIYHLDVGAMYPNIILTNRLQPSAVVNEETCAACDFNKPGALCQRKMTWMWRGEYMPANRNEYQLIQQQLETEKFPPLFPDGKHRAFHQLSKEEQAAIEKKRLTDYCRKAYKKVHITRMEERISTICQKENSFYVDTVRAFRDRRYEYKNLNKKAKKQVSEAVAQGNVTEIKSAKNLEILYDSLQLAHKCILNSFYGYVMRKGSRWHSMEMAGIVCYTGAHIIKKAREIVEQIGRPLELDTDGIWCILPASFPENYEVNSTKKGKEKVTISFPNAILNCMVKDFFTNHVYHELVDKELIKYEIKSENSIFFEVDGPYLAMVLPASKEEGKKLKKRYAVFNFDGSLAELKGFEVKRRGELQLIKIFQSSVFEAFLKGNNLEKCYEAVAKIANYWLDVLYSKAYNMPDSQLFDLISENRSMSRKLEDYGNQKSLSISTAKRLAEFLGDQMVKDAGLACKYIISKKPENFPVTERAIPLAIFQADESVKRHYLRKWLKDFSIMDIDIRDILDWDYYIERLGGTIQKIITIPAAMQGLTNPVPRVHHPDWLHKKILEKTDSLKQRKISQMFISVEKPINTEKKSFENPINDIEDIVSNENNSNKPKDIPVVQTNKRKRVAAKTWREFLGPLPISPWNGAQTSNEFEKWLNYHIEKWKWQKSNKISLENENYGITKKSRSSDIEYRKTLLSLSTNTLGNFLKKAQHSLFTTPWQILQINESTSPGVFKIWALVGSELHQIRLIVPRIFYVNYRISKELNSDLLFKKCNRFLPRSRSSYFLYEYSVPEEVYKEHSHEMLADLSTPEVEGIYETQVPLLFRALVKLGCICSVDPDEARRLAVALPEQNTFMLNHLSQSSVNHQSYLNEDILKNIYLYHHKANTGYKSFLALFLIPSKRAIVIVLDTVKTNQMPNLNNLYTSERNLVLANSDDNDNLPPAEINFEIKFEINLNSAYKIIQQNLRIYKDEKRGPTLLVIQSQKDIEYLTCAMPGLNDFPIAPIYVQDPESVYNNLDWQRIGSKLMIKQYLNFQKSLKLQIEQCRYFRLPIGNIPPDTTLFGSDLLYSRELLKNNFVLWCSDTSRPDLGGSEVDDNRLLMDIEESSKIVSNYPGSYTTICIEFDVDSLAVNTLLQSHHVHDIEGSGTSIGFDTTSQITISDIVKGQTSIQTSYDETALTTGILRVLRHMVAGWLRDVSYHKNKFADFQMVHFYRWLRSPNAFLYDPALCRTLHNLMKKLFLQLIAEFKRLGSVIVYANFNKIIICTKKKRMEDAITYVEFVASNIRNKELFHIIQMSYSYCWRYLIWLDPANHGGVQSKLPVGLKCAGENSKDFLDSCNEQFQQEDNESPEIVMNWNMSEYLPEKGKVQEYFTSLIAGYISSVWSQIKKQQISLNSDTPLRRKVTSSQAQPMGVGTNVSLKDYASALITGDLSQKLFNITQRINETLSTKSGDPNNVFPKLPGSNLLTFNASLEFVKSVCKILSLDKDIEEEVNRLKRNLLRLINVGEFSDESEWRDPCTTIILPEVICRSCNHCRDIDLCRDCYTNENNGGHYWHCPICESNYDNKEIEYILLDIVNRKTMGYTLQDLQCSKCLQIKQESLTRHCSCTGSFKTLINREELGKYLKTFKSISACFNMPFLSETVEWILKLNPTLECNRIYNDTL